MVIKKNNGMYPFFDQGSPVLPENYQFELDRWMQKQLRSGQPDHSETKCIVKAGV